jgi:hypothetical protein
MGGRKDLKILLLQIRDNQNVRNEEHQSFANFSKLEVHQIEIGKALMFFIANILIIPYL